MMRLSQGDFATVLICLVAVACLLGLVGVWFPQLFKDNDVGWKLIYSFIVLSISIAIGSGIMTYLPK